MYSLNANYKGWNSRKIVAGSGSMFFSQQSSILCSVFLLTTCILFGLATRDMPGRHSYIYRVSGVRMNYVISTVSAESLMTCCSLCTLDMRCLGISYLSTERRCDLNDKDPINYLNMSRKEDGWITYGREASCMDSGWVAHESACYKVVMTQVKWRDAGDHCGDVGGYLTDILDASESMFVNGAVQTESQRLGVPVPNYWIGLQHVGSGVHAWLSGRPYGFQNFSPGNPSFGGDNCVYVDGNMNHWDDENCNVDKYACVCKKDNF